jgi:hypothetical protein
MPNVLELWEKYSGWGPITEEQFTNWYLETPYGQCTIIVAVDDEDVVVGQIVFIPSCIYLNGDSVKSLRASAPILSDKVRNLNIKDYHHPVYVMLRQGMQHAKLIGYDIVYMFPSKGWTSVLKTFPKYGLPEPQIVFYDCINISLQDPKTFIEESRPLTIQIADKFTQEYDELWEKSKKALPISCGVIRDEAWIRWKLTKHLVLEARDIFSNELKGFLAFNKKTGLVIDMLCVSNEVMQDIFLSVIKKIHYQNEQKIDVSFTSINVMATPILTAILKGISWQMKNFTFAFACYSLGKEIEQKLIEPSNWYMMPND